MPRIPTRRTTGATPTTRTGAVQVPTNIFSAKDAADRNLTTAQRAVTAGFSKLGENMLRLQRADQISNAQLDYEAKYQEFKQGLLTNTDYDSHDQAFEDFHAKQTASALNSTTNRSAKRALLGHFKDRQTNYGAATHIGAFRLNAHEAATMMPVKLEQYQTAIVKADTVEERMRLEEEMVIYLSNLQESGMFSEEELDARVTEAQAGIDEAIATVAVGSELAAARQIYDSTGDQKLALDYIRNSELIPEKDKQEMQSDLVAEVGYRAAEDKRNVEQAQRNETESVYSRLNTGDYSGIEDFINAQPALTEVQKADLIDASRAHVKADVADDLDQSPFNQGSPAVFNQLLGRVRNDPAGITNSEILALTAKPDGITTGQYNELSRIHDQKLKDLQSPGEDPLQRAEVTRAHAQIQRMRGFAVQGVDFGDELAVEQKYQVIQNQLDTFAEKLDINDPDFDKKIENETLRLLSGPVENVQLGFFQRALFHKEDSLGAKVFGKRAVTEEKALANKKFNALEKHDVFSTMSDIEKDQAQKLFEQGKTVNDVVNLLLSNE